MRVAEQLQTILGNLKILEKSQIWVETEPSVYAPSQILNFGSSSQKIRKSRRQSFVFGFIFPAFLYFFSNTLPKII